MDANRTRGIYHKFYVSRTDGKHKPGQKHDGCEYFVLDLTHDVYAKPALLAYAKACAIELPQLANDLFTKATVVPESYVMEVEKRQSSAKAGYAAGMLHSIRLLQDESAKLWKQFGTCVDQVELEKIVTSARLIDGLISNIRTQLDIETNTSPN